MRLAASEDEPAGERLRSLVVRGAGPGTRPLVLDVMRLPKRPFALGFEPRVLAVVRGSSRADAAFAETLQQAYGLTATEAQIALRLADGDAREVIADDRGVSIQTLRTHIRNLFLKVGVRREGELSARINELR